MAKWQYGAFYNSLNIKSYLLSGAEMALESTEKRKEARQGREKQKSLRHEEDKNSREGRFKCPSRKQIYTRGPSNLRVNEIQFDLFEQVFFNFFFFYQLPNTVLGVRGNTKPAHVSCKTCTCLLQTCMYLL